jgi:hypothetical protein
MREPTVSHAALQRAVERGIISQQQLDALLGDASAPDTPPPPPPVEAPQAFNAITVAYYLGAFVVLFAFGWFLVDRWRSLGPSGVLAVALIYAALFLGTSEFLRRQRFEFASAVAMLLAVGMTPLITWALLDLGGMWPSARPGQCEASLPFVLECRGKWMVIELTTILASLVALRRVQNALLMEPIAIALLVLTFHIVESIFGRTFDSTAAGWAIILAASLMLLLAYTVDLRNTTKHDYAFSLYIPALIAAFSGMQLVWTFDPAFRHALLPIAIIALAVAIYMRRRLFLIFGAVTFIWYLGWLAFDVFRKVVALPIMLATVGFLVILGAVWLQRNYPRIVARVSASNQGRRTMPAGHVLFLTPALLALLMIPLAGRVDRELDRKRRQDQQAWAIRFERQERARRAARDSAQRTDGGRQPDTVTRRVAAPR